MSVEKETITLHRNKTALTGKPPSTHIEKEYNVLKDETLEGMRTIVLQEKDLSIQHEKARKLADTIAEEVGEGKSKAFKGMLFDIFRDYYEKTIDKLLKMIERGESVKVKEGCFKVIIGDGRKNSSEEIMLRE